MKSKDGKSPSFQGAKPVCTAHAGSHWLSMPDAARISGISYSTLSRWVRVGAIPGTAKVGSVTLISRPWAEAVKRFVNYGAITPGVDISPIKPKPTGTTLSSLVTSVDQL